MSATTCTNHCSACGRHFHSVRAYDAHRIGSYSDPDNPRRCEHPLDLFDADGGMRLVAVTAGGECRMYAEVERGVTVWSLAGHAEGLLERLSELPVDAQTASVAWNPAS